MDLSVLSEMGGALYHSLVKTWQRCWTQAVNWVTEKELNPRTSIMSLTLGLCGFHHFLSLVKDSSAAKGGVLGEWRKGTWSKSHVVVKYKEWGMWEPKYYQWFLSHWLTCPEFRAHLAQSFLTEFSGFLCWEIPIVGGSEFMWMCTHAFTLQGCSVHPSLVVPNPEKDFIQASLTYGETDF